MTVQQLITHLQQYPEDWEVRYCSEYANSEPIEVIKEIPEEHTILLI